MMFYVYLITNLVNGKLYVGKGANVNARWQQHRMIAAGGKDKYPKRFNYLHRAISKYGVVNFSITTLGSYEQEQLAFAEEINYIAKFKAENYQLYNLTNGGEGSSGCKRTEASNDKNRQAHLGKFASDETKKKLSLMKQNISEETKYKQLMKKYGEKSSNAKLTWNEVNLIRRLNVQGISCTKLAKQFCVSISTISCICLFKSWKFNPND